MHNALFAQTKKATYLFEPKLDLLRSEIILISRSKNMIFLGKGNLKYLFATISHQKRHIHRLFFEPKLDFCHVRIYFHLQLDKDDFSLKRQPTLPFCRLITPKRRLPLPF